MPVQSHLSSPLHATPTYILAAILGAVVIVTRLPKSPNLDAFPTVGSSSWLGSWRAGLTFSINAIELFHEGYEKYKAAPFKVAAGFWWMVVISSREHMEEVRNAPEDVLSFRAATNEIAKPKYTMGSGFGSNSHHLDVVISQLTRNIGTLYDGIRDEVSEAFDEALNLKDNEWKGVAALPTIQKVVCRTSNRLFVGLPLCRDPDWVDLNVQYTVSVQNATRILMCFPEFLLPIVSCFLIKPAEGRKRGVELLAPAIKERMELLEEHGEDWPEKPNDMLSWLIDLTVDPQERTAESLANRMLSVNFAAIHSTSNSFTQALFFLAERPEYIQPLREEVESIVNKEGWSKASLGKMHKIDSFLKECQRLVGNNSELLMPMLGAATLFRKAVKDFTFSDGTLIPKGTLIVAASRCLHLDSEYYPDAHVFDPFRFSNMWDDGDATKQQFAVTSLEYLPFGHGKHACPGRFFAANELKSMLAHVVMMYDIKLEGNKARPEPLRRGVSIAPDPTVRVMFRKRVYQRALGDR